MVAGQRTVARQPHSQLIRRRCFLHPSPSHVYTLLYDISFSFFFSFSSFFIYFFSILSNPMGPSEFSLILICAQRMTPTASARESDVREDSRPLYVPKPISTATGCRGHASFLATVSICRRPEVEIR